MPGPYSSDRRAGSDGPPATEGHPAAAVYPGPPPLPYPKPRRRALLIGLLVVLLVTAVATAGVLYAYHRPPAAPAAAFSEASAKTAIQGYLDALENRDVETVARNSLCGIYDAVRDRRSDQAVAKLSSDAFRKQFSEAKLTSVDKIVYWSDYQAQVLFTMQVQPPAGTSTTRSEVQGIAQLLNQHNQILVCSYVLHSAGMY